MNDLREEQHIINLIKGGFEEKYGIPLNIFLDKAHYIIINKPKELKINDNIKKWIDLTAEQKVIRLVKGGFEIQNGFPLNYFVKIYKDLITNHPEKLI